MTVYTFGFYFSCYNHGQSGAFVPLDHIFKWTVYSVTNACGMVVRSCRARISVTSLLWCLSSPCAFHVPCHWCMALSVAVFAWLSQSKFLLHWFLKLLLLVCSTCSHTIKLCASKLLHPWTLKNASSMLPPISSLYTLSANSVPQSLFSWAHLSLSLSCSHQFLSGTPRRMENFRTGVCNL